jgi:hypothetical protein
MSTGGWHCEAYGADDRLPRCFFETVCTSRRQCSVRMRAERRRLFDRIQQLGRLQPEVYGWLAEEFRSPAELLGGPVIVTSTAIVEAAEDDVRDDSRDCGGYGPAGPD